MLDIRRTLCVSAEYELSWQVDSRWPPLKLRGQSAKAALTVPVYPPRSHSVVREVQRVALRRPIHKWAHIARRRETQKSVGDTGS
jgi:hypothetical protein